ncbi:murein L,D-transpeptidase [Desulfopila sp. IMCC35006]|uniref:L,D-transpeptidase family protein n=1 Tax=Desulfopila sp. IMCC35006 TaxID=2569542 RepID=UPI0010AD93CB|nr:L,D-transpeptidase family protein [Desulfopila sp. IMCC35006]TKB27476.1 murein L,D-transpeptidase [Desulfopila sp. IMCC35006]
MFSHLTPSRQLLKFPFKKVFGCCLMLLLTVADNGYSRPTDAELSKAISSHLLCFPLATMEPDKNLPTFTTQNLCLTEIYNKTGVEPLWVSTEGPTEKAQTILNYLTNAYQHGLNPQEYKVDRLGELWPAEDAEKLAELDTALTYNLVKYIHDISYGQLKPLASDPELFAEAGEKTFNPVLAMKHVLSTGNLNDFLASLPPQHHQYRGLKAGLAHYRKIAENGGWTTVPGGPSLRPGDIDPRISAVRKRLQVTDPLLGPAQGSAATVFDPMLKEAVLAFQRQNGLTPDGIIGKNTISALNISVAENIATIRINMARWRWQAHDLGKRYVLANIASFNLKAFEDDEIVLDMPVIVGQEQHQTPVFSGKIKYIDVNPFWNIPPSIAQKEELPALRKNSNYLVNRHVRLFSSWRPDAAELDSRAIDWHTVTQDKMAGYKLRQDPGPWNALGKIKFVFPNTYSVYMHDTPAHNLFDRTKRDFSHGCIRVSNGLNLALFLLKDQAEAWPVEKFKEIYNQLDRKVIQLPVPVPVHITYLTTWVDKNGTILFNRDIYARDAKLYSTLLK